MNRQLKFRIWDKQNKKWIYEWGASHKRLAISLVGLVYHGGYDDVLPENDYVIQQYTGLKDSKGNDIYEGDILTCKYADQEVTEAISYSEDYSSFTHGEHALWRGWIGEAEIIGNIFENPDYFKNNE
jgi:hypothetical protein